MSEAANARREKKYAKLAKAAWVNNEPRFNPLDYTASLMRNFNFYNSEIDAKDKMEWALRWYKENGYKVTDLRRLSPGYFAQIGALVRLIDRGIALEQKEMSYLPKRYLELQKLAEEQAVEEAQEEKTAPKRASIQDLVRRQAQDIAGEIDGMIDDILITGKAQEDITKWVKARHLSQPVVKYLIQYFKFSIEDVNAEDAAEVYNPKTLKPLKKFYTELDAALGVVKATKIVKPRVKKQKPAGELVKNMKFMKDGEGLTGESPVKIIGSKEVYLFNTERRKLTQIVAVDGMLLSVKGTTIINMDPEKSTTKTVRKPEILKDAKGSGLRAMRNLFKDIKAVARPANGRTSDKTLILATF